MATEDLKHHNCNGVEQFVRQNGVQVSVQSSSQVGRQGVVGAKDRRAASKSFGEKLKSERLSSASKRQPHAMGKN